MRKFVTFQEALGANVSGSLVFSWLDRDDMPYNTHTPRYDELTKGVRIDKFQLLGEEITRFEELRWSIED